MDLLQHLRRLFAYDDWANREALRALRTAEPLPARSLKLVAHIVAAEELWLGRILGDKTPVEVWPSPGPGQVAERIERMAQRWRDHLEDMTPEKLSARVAYVNSKGEPWESAVEDALLHVALHSAYHRGQVAADMRAAGHTPAYTDFIHCIRKGFVK